MLWKNYGHRLPTFRHLSYAVSLATSGVLILLNSVVNDRQLMNLRQ